MFKAFFDSTWAQLGALAALVVWLELRDGPVAGSWKQPLREAAAGVVVWSLLYLLVTQGQGCAGLKSQKATVRPSLGPLHGRHVQRGLDVGHELAHRLDTGVRCLAPLDLVDRRGRDTREDGQAVDLRHAKGRKRGSDFFGTEGSVCHTP